MRRQDNRLAAADKIAGGAEGVDFARRDAGEGLVVVWVAEEDLFLVLVDGLGVKGKGGREGIGGVGKGYGEEDRREGTHNGLDKVGFDRRRDLRGG
jgi:hypothetical protein